MVDIDELDYEAVFNEPDERDYLEDNFKPDSSRLSRLKAINILIARAVEEDTVESYLKAAELLKEKQCIINKIPTPANTPDLDEYRTD